MPNTIPEPWLSFLREIDQGLEKPVEVHCLGAFVLMVMWDLPRATGDIDVVEVTPTDASGKLMQLGGEGSELSRKYRLQIHRVGIAEYPENYVDRLIDITPAVLVHLRVLAFDVMDVVLAKLARNSPRDRQDVARRVSRRPHPRSVA